MIAREAGQRISTAPEGQRLDKWLWYARVAKTRTTAAGLVDRGRVRVNRARISKPSHTLKVGDVVTAAVGRAVRVLKVVALGSRRGPATEARTLYEELTPAPETLKAQGASVTPSEMHGTQHATDRRQSHGARSPGSGRPTKRERRAIDRFKTIEDG